MAERTSTFRKIVIGAGLVAGLGRARLLLAIALAVAAVGTAAIWLSPRPPYASGGPLAWPSEYGVETHLPRGGIGSWGIVLPPFEEGGPVAIESVEPFGEVTGLTILDTLASDPAGMAIGMARGYPEPAEAFHPVPGSTISNRSGPSPHLQIVFVVRLDAEEGHIPAVRVRYSSDGQRYETVLAWWLTVRPSED